MAEPHQLGHRERVRERIKAQGLVNMTEYEILEFLLFQAVPYKDTKDLAYELIKKFHSIYGVCQAKEEDLYKIKGMTKGAVYFMKMLPQIVDVYVRDSSRAQEAESPSQALKYLSQTVQGNEEVCYILGLDQFNYVNSFKKIATGDKSSLTVSTKEILEECKANSIKKVIIAHNHPSGIARPSEADYLNTARLDSTLSKNQIELVDHYIISGIRAYSVTRNFIYRLDQVDIYKEDQFVEEQDDEEY